MVWTSYVDCFKALPEELDRRFAVYARITGNATLGLGKDIKCTGSEKDSRGILYYLIRV